MTNKDINTFINKSFLSLFITQFLGAFNDNLYKNALIIFLVFNLPADAKLDSQYLVTIAVGLFILPFFLFSSTGGQLADKYPQHILIRWTKIMEILIMIWGAIAFINHHTTHLLMVLFFMGTQSAFFGPVKYSIIPSIVPKKDLLKANSFVEAATFLAILLGTIAGGLIIMHNQGHYIIAIAIVSIAIAGLVSSTFILPLKAVKSSLRLNWNLVSENIHIIQYTKKHHTLFCAIIGISWIWLLGAIFLSQFPYMVKETLYSSQSVVTFFLTLFSVGVAMGSLLCNKVCKGCLNTLIVPISGLIICIFCLDLSYILADYPTNVSGEIFNFKQFINTFLGYRISIDLLIISIASGLYIVPLYVMLQSKGKNSHRARIIASNNVFNSLFMVLSTLYCLLLFYLNYDISQIIFSLALLTGLQSIWIFQIIHPNTLKKIYKYLFFRKVVTPLSTHQANTPSIYLITKPIKTLPLAFISSYLTHPLVYIHSNNYLKTLWYKIILFFMEFITLKSWLQKKESLLDRNQEICSLLISTSSLSTVSIEKFLDNIRSYPIYQLNFTDNESRIKTQAIHPEQVSILLQHPSDVQ